ncbi:transcriptional regulator [Mammaliicoccus sciuri]|uniref:Lrp/AsnC family transcriptional regulator n=1 Tax=Mammaliicoccus sciuri TaxID=1296 RepID=UPI0007342E24|nr:Lrp/AsnC family transcriptional regulator [Mammaliicoccus sciuri]KTT86516.1 transcriptional regulator [Mammaliicoccus sciuri]KTT86670.1 transcriptional regulator [Mammaliicoccus sciuri]KTT86796.1 transcriptional regulator [Mammaliicoccus sciuri]KTT93455.1 transcriptional regulator [Mammaliicoccus sciuri]KTW10862.1 transcriptional regulator [Mammaliicoccus sciuri]
MAIYNTDKMIFNELQRNAKITMKDLGKKVFKLESNGVIQNYTIQINQKRLDCAIHTFINIYMNKISHLPFLEFVDTKSSYILHNYKIIGDGCYLLECRLPNNKHLNTFLEDLNVFANYNISTVL